MSRRWAKGLRRSASGGRARLLVDRHGRSERTSALSPLASELRKPHQVPTLAHVGRSGRNTCTASHMLLPTSLLPSSFCASVASSVSLLVECHLHHLTTWLPQRALSRSTGRSPPPSAPVSMTQPMSTPRRRFQPGDDPRCSGPPADGDNSEGATYFQVGKTSTSPPPLSRKRLTAVAVADDAWE